MPDKAVQRSHWVSILAIWLRPREKITRKGGGRAKLGKGGGRAKNRKRRRQSEKR